MRLGAVALAAGFLCGCGANADKGISADASRATTGVEKGGTDETGPYDVVENWFKPLHEGKDQCVDGVYAESPARIYMVTQVEVPVTRPPGNCSSERDVPGTHRHAVLVVDENGRVVEEWTQWNELFGMPHSVKMNPYDPEKHVWIVDSEWHMIREFSHDGKELVLTLGEKNVSGTDDSHFNRPTDIAFFPDGSFLVADGYGNSRLVKFDKSGKFLSAWGTNGSGPGQLKVPHGIAIGADRRVYVADRDNQRIQIFDENGTYLDEWPNVRSPVSLIAGQDGSLSVLTGLTNRILKYDHEGRLLTYWGTANNQEPFPGSFYAPHAFSVDSAGNLYVADYRNHRAQKFTPKKNADPGRLIAQPVR